MLLSTNHFIFKVLDWLPRSFDFLNSFDCWVSWELLLVNHHSVIVINIKPIKQLFSVSITSNIIWVSPNLCSLYNRGRQQLRRKRWIISIINQCIIIITISILQLLIDFILRSLRTACCTYTYTIRKILLIFLPATTFLKWYQTLFRISHLSF